MTDVMVVAGARTAIGDYGGAFKDVPPTKLGAIAIREALARAKAEPASVVLLKVRWTRSAASSMNETRHCSSSPWIGSAIRMRAGYEMASCQADACLAEMGLGIEPSARSLRLQTLRFLFWLDRDSY